MLLDEVADREIALGDPWTFVEQARCLEERREIDADALSAKPLERLAEKLGRLRVAEELELRIARHADARAGERPRHRARRRSLPARERIERVVAGGHPQHRRGVGCSERKDRDAIERAT